MKGIYKFTNKSNGKVYIGQSTNLEKRYKEHKYNHLNQNYCNYNSKFYRALRKYGFENFKYDILEECVDVLEKEVFYIEAYNSYNNGYNSTKGGEDNPSFKPEVVRVRTEKLLNDKEINQKLSHKGEKNPNASLSKENVIEIRTRYLKGESKSIVYKDFESKVTFSAFDYCWRGRTWSDIMPEVFSQRPLVNHGGSKLSEEDVYEIRLRLRQGEEKKNIYEDFKDRVGEAGFRKIALGYTWKNVII